MYSTLPCHLYINSCCVLYKMTACMSRVHNYSVKNKRGLGILPHKKIWIPCMNLVKKALYQVCCHLANKIQLTCFISLVNFLLLNFSSNDVLSVLNICIRHTNSAQEIWKIICEDLYVEMCTSCQRHCCCWSCTLST